MESSYVDYKESDLDFSPADKQKIKEDAIPGQSLSYMQDAWRRLKKDKVSMLCLIVVIVLVLIAIFGPYISKFDYASNNLLNANKAPNKVHWFGTDQLGRDIFVRVMYGARISLSVGFVAAIINLTIGLLYGGFAGYKGGMVDNIMMRIVDILYSIPMMLYVILLMVVMGKGLGNVYITLGIAYWTGMARIVRGQVLSLKNQEFILAAKAAGANGRRILLKHLIPNCMGQIIVTLTLSIPDAIFTEAFLSFVGLGVSAPMSSWGTLCNDALATYRSYPYQLFIPAMAICITMIAFNLLGDGLRDALDPKMRK
ncbi:ABC transporter permease [Clostridium oryzae]|uniref:Oligopeptide transport system permease protein OppC n=1 Tax=Clostridium oryzae TaxID=1450648 RepID=A0A1V4I9J0_9CLOT|nr:ABC transporter permease [Clostridium oryzae]OPJ56540.1 oligopeptide transport system permease protein OppC [Clostridium oryzae]